MHFDSFSLNGTWEMRYSEEKYLGKENPFSTYEADGDIAGTEPADISNSFIENAVPGYWEDMTGKFLETPFFRELRINPEYGLQQYPIAGGAPDMALPNIIGNFFYRKSFTCDEINSDAYIHFEGVQNAVSVWINNQYLGRHQGYSAPFEIKIPSGLIQKGLNTVVLSVSNHRLEGYDGEPVSGLTTRAANECTGGITGDVEIRVYLSPVRDVAILISDNCKQADVRVDLFEQTEFLWRVCDGDNIINKGCSNGNFSFDTSDLNLWSPESPKQYSLEIECNGTTLKQNFGVRKLTGDDSRLYLNGIPYFLRGVCEHCYFPETIHPTHDLAYYRNVIKNLKMLGFNFIRFHTYTPEEEYMQAADELGMLIQVESPNNATVDEWKEIICFCRKHPSVVIYCCGNELLMDDPFIEHLRKCADIVHSETDSLFAPMSAMRGLEYFWCEPKQKAEIVNTPIKHHPRRLKTTGEFSDVYCSYPEGLHSYYSLDGTPEDFDKAQIVYNKPRLSHEICIDGTYTDLSLKGRYKNTKVGNTQMFDSLERHLEAKGVLHKAPTYFKNSCRWQQINRKYCFEKLRASKFVAGYDFLGPIDTHWHTFGYDVGMMNEFYELKPGETLRNVLMYNSDTVLLTDLGKKRNYFCGEIFRTNISVSHFGCKNISNAELTIRLMTGGKVINISRTEIGNIQQGGVSSLVEFEATLPTTEKPVSLKLYVTLDGDGVFVENEWEIYAFPKPEKTQQNKLVICDSITQTELISHLENGKDVLLLGSEPFASTETSFRIALAGRTSGNLATVIADHPAIDKLPHEGFCGWQFSALLEGGRAVCFECDNVPFNPIIEVASTHKYVVKQAAMFEFAAINGRLLVCSFNFDSNDPASLWLKSNLVDYIKSDSFSPVDSINKDQLIALMNVGIKKTAANTNLAFNQNDKTSTRKKK